MPDPLNSALADDTAALEAAGPPAVTVPMPPTPGTPAPTPGRQVHFSLAEGNNEGQVRPATVVTCNGYLATLAVLVVVEDLTAEQAAILARLGGVYAPCLLYYDVPFNGGPGVPRTWCWPPRK